MHDYSSKKESPKTGVSTLEWICRLLLATVFLLAGIPKVIDTVGFAQTIGAYGMLPDVLLLPAAVILSLTEVIAGIGLLLGYRAAHHLIGILLIFFISVLSYAIFLGLDIDCGCFSIDDPEYQAFSGLRTALFRDLFLLLPLFYLYWQQGLYKILKRS